MAITVKYAGTTLTPTPFVGESIRSNIDGDYTYQVYDYSLNGFITGNVDSAKNTLLDVFSGDFGEFIVSGNDILITGYSCLVRNVNFSPSRANGVASYSIDLECYNKDQFDSFGVVSPVNEWSFQEERNGVYNITHRVAAQGLNLSGYSPYFGAKAFVENFTGVGTFIPGRFGRYSTIAAGDLELFSVTRNANNAAGSYSIEELYKVAMTGNTVLSTVTEYNFDIASGIGDDFITVNLNVSQQCRPDDYITGYLIPSGDLYQIALNNSNAGLNPQPIAFDFNLTNQNTAQYRISYTDDEFITFFDYNQGYQFDTVTQNTDIDINGVIKSKGNLKQRYINVSAFYATTVGGDSGLEAYLYGIANTFYDSIAGQFNLNNKASRLYKKENPYKGEIEIGATFSDRDHITGFIDANWTAEFSLPIQTIVPRASCMVTGLWKMYDTQVNSRERVSINVGGISYLTSPSVANQEMLNLLDRVEDAYLENTNLVLENETKTLTTGTVHNITYRREHSFDDSPFINVAPSVINSRL
jgi:hypothetical protein